MAGAKLRLTSGRDPNPSEFVSDPGGRFVFPSLAEGNYQVSAIAPEFAEVKTTFRVDRRGHRNGRRHGSGCSVNAHRNGYADPNIYIANVIEIESVQVDGGAFNVREGNHALNLGTTYGLHSHLDPFLTLTGDDRDITGTAGMNPSTGSWIAVEARMATDFWTAWNTASNSNSMAGRFGTRATTR